MAFALAGARIFDGAHLRDGETVIVERGRIAAVVDAADLAAGPEGTEHAPEQAGHLMVVVDDEHAPGRTLEAPDDRLELRAR